METIHPDDEIVVCMTRADWDRMLTILIDAYTCEDHAESAGRIDALVKRLAHNADVLTLNWLDRKLAEFP